MAIFTVNYTKKTDFMKDPRLVTRDENNEVINEGRYNKHIIPEAVNDFTPSFSLRKNRYLIDIDQEKLNTIVEAMYVYDEDGNHIQEAPLRALNAPFWSSKAATISIPNNGISLDEDNPRDKFWIEVFKSDPSFRFAEDELPPSKMSLVQYTVTKLGEEDFEENELQDKTFEAMSLLKGMENFPEKMQTILRAMGTEIRKASDDNIRRALQNKITYGKDQRMPGSSETNIDAFIRMASEDTRTFVVKAHITKALSDGVINRKKEGTYWFGDIKIGGSRLEVEKYLTNEDNLDVLEEIVDLIKED